MNRYYLKSFGLIEVTGTDRQSFLHSQLSNNILDLALDEACYATYNNPKGRVLANFIICQLSESILLILKKELIPTIIQKLNMYKLRSKIELKNKSDCYHIIGSFDIQLIGSVPFPLKFTLNSTQKVISLSCPNGSKIDIDSQEPTKTDIISDENGWNLFEIEQGFPWVTQASSEKCVAQMLNQEWLGAIHFKKGCYPGQEIIARSQYRGEVKRRPALLSSKNEYTIGSSLYQTGQEVGIILNKARTQDNSFIYLTCIKINCEPTLYADKTDTTQTLILEHLFYYKKEIN